MAVGHTAIGSGKEKVLVKKRFWYFTVGLVITKSGNSHLVRWIKIHSPTCSWIIEVTESRETCRAITR